MHFFNISLKKIFRFIKPLKYLPGDTFRLYPRIKKESMNKWIIRVNQEASVDAIKNDNLRNLLSIDYEEVEDLS